MKVLTTDQQREADAYTIAHEPVPSIDLMERAAMGLMRVIENHPCAQKSFRIFAGYGNNGGDGIALARLLCEKGRYVSLHVISPEKGYSSDARTNIERLPEEDNLQVSVLKEGDPLPQISINEVVVDALFGSGLTREPSGLIASVIDHINASGACVISVDIPSGLFGEDNRMNSRKHVVRAETTLTFESPKLCFFLPKNHNYVGDWHVIPIGLHPDYLSRVTSIWNYIAPSDVRGWIRSRSKFSHKGTYGHALLAVGSTGKAGAAVLAASACVRAGAGLTTVAVPGSANGIIQTAVPEAMTRPDRDADQLTESLNLESFSAIGIGPGIGTTASTWEVLLSLLDNAAVPMILDADALNLLALHPGSILKVPKNSILTPHPGEFRRLFGEDPDDYSRLIRMRQIAEQYGIVLVLKGAHTVITGPDGSVWFNNTGNPGMATGGSGDVLTGILTGLVAQGYDPLTAARLGVYLHGLAGDLAATETGQESLTAGDIIKYLGKAFIEIHNYPL